MVASPPYVALLVVLALSSSTMGCEASDGPALRVDLRTDYVPGLEFARVRTEIGGGTGASGAFADHDAAATADYLEGVRVGEFEGLDAGDLSLTIQLLRLDGTTLASRLAVVRFSKSAGVTVLLSRSCADVTCPGTGDPATERACVAGSCVDPTCLAGDEETCAPPQCSEAADCAAGSSCMLPVCRGGACLLATDPDSCAAGMVCHPVLGCVAAAGDGGMACEIPCDPVLPQCGCEPADSCALAEDGNPECAPTPTPAPAIGEACEGAASCDTGLVCVSRPGGLCVQLCRGDADCVEGRCSRVVNSVAGARTQFRSCTMPCSPLVGDTTCPNGTRCVLSTQYDVDPPRVLADCDGPVGIRPEGDPCGDFTHCARGLACIDDVCRLLCDLAAPDCPSGLTCDPRSFLSADVGDFGICE
ncbi:MAG: hypothetical protein DRJ42_04615 [Deltaproteobacteria bacterium]|nr:MAG: hypothetical protein DRJ42_04615 [Deltaproteobacteria bacterium]